MLDPWIIEEIRRREEGRREDGRLPAVIDIPLQGPAHNDRSDRQQQQPEKTPRGIEIIDFHYAESDGGVTYNW